MANVSQNAPVGSLVEMMKRVFIEINPFVGFGLSKVRSFLVF